MLAPLIASTVFEGGFAASAAVALAMLATILAIGVLLVPQKETQPCDLLRLAAATVSGLLFFNGLAATVLFGRLGFFSIVPLLQAALAVWLWRKHKGGPLLPLMDIRLAVPLALTAAGCIGFVHWWSAFQTADGAVRDLHSDLGYFAQLALGLREAGHASLWAGTLGPALTESGGPLDVWYHWGPIWFAAAVHEITGLPPLEALVQTGEMVFSFVLVLTAGAIVRSLVPWRPGWCLLVGGVSLLAVPLLKMAGALWLTGILPYGVLQHHRASLMMQMAYKADALPLLLALAAWLRAKDVLAAAMLLIAGICSPHAVAAGGVMAGGLLVAGLLMRNRQMWRTAVAIIAILLSSWGLLAGLLGVSLPKSADSEVMSFGFNSLRLALRAGLVDSVIGMALAGLLIPGIVHLMRRTEGGMPDARPRILGWMTVSALAGGYAAFHLFRTMGDRFHFTMFTHVVLILPAGIWGLASLASRSTGGLRAASVALIAACGLMGISDLVSARSHVERVPWTPGDVRAIKSALGSETFGYFADTDRNWWIPKRSTLASMLNVRCVRLNPIAAVDEKGVNTAFYGSSRPFALLPRQPGESDSQWSLRFARKLGITRILEVGDERMPTGIRNGMKLLTSSGPLRLFELRQP